MLIFLVQIKSCSPFQSVMSAMSANLRKRGSTKKVNSGDAFPTRKSALRSSHKSQTQANIVLVYHRINQPKHPSRIFNPMDHGPGDSITFTSSAFPALSRFFGTLLVAAQLPFVKASGGISEELSNNIIADLAPFLALFGEQVTKQFMSQSMCVTDNIIFACAPLGIITAIVGAIRVGGPKALTAIIGRARESRSAVEIELMSSTSVDVCELWDGQGVVRAMGAAPIIELIYLVPKKSKYRTMEPEIQKIWTEGNFGIYDFESAKSSILECESSNGDVDPGNRGSEAPLLGGRDAAPNISLNFGGNPIHDMEYFAVAAIGVILQLGVIVYAFLSYLLSPWSERFEKEGYRAAIYAPLMICGTSTLVIGMYLCSHIIERSTVEQTWKVKKMTQDQAQVRVAWLQQGGEVNDQAFDSYVLFPANSIPASTVLTTIVRHTTRFFSFVHQQVNSHWRVYGPGESLREAFSGFMKKIFKIIRLPLDLVLCCWFCFPANSIPASAVSISPSTILTTIVRQVTRFFTFIHQMNCHRRVYSMCQAFGSGMKQIFTIIRPLLDLVECCWCCFSCCCWWSGVAILKSLSRRFGTPSQKLRALQALLHARRYRHRTQLTIRTSRQAQTTNQHNLVWIAVLVSVCGFVGQFLGLRGLHWSVTVAQLVATCIMTVLRSSIRRNLLHKPETKKLPLGYELDWMARDEIKGCTHWSVVTWGFDRPIQPSSDQPEGTIAEATMSARRRLGALSNWPSQWHDSINSTVEAIEESMHFMFSTPDIAIQSDYWSKRDRFEWKIVVQVGSKDSDRTHLEEISLNLNRTKLLDGPWGPWRVVKSEIEAVIGLWMLHFKHHKSAQDIQSAIASEWQSDEAGLLREKPIFRVLGPYDGLERMSYENWIGRQTDFVRVDDIAKFTEGETRNCDIAIGVCSESHKRGVPVLGVITTTILERICGQVIYSQLILNLSKHMTIGGKVNLRQGDQGVKTSFGLSCAGLTGLVEIVERAGLANTEEAYMSIVPVVSRFGKLPIGPDETRALFGDIVNATNDHYSNSELERAEWCRLWLVHVAELAADVYKDRKDWRLAGEVYLQFRRESQYLLHGTDHIKDVSQRIASFCEHVFASVATGRRKAGNQTFSDSLELVGTCMTKTLGEISEMTLARWKASAKGGNSRSVVKNVLLCQAATEGKAFLVEVLLEDGADIEAHDGDHRTPLTLACISGHGAIASRLIERHADINTKDYLRRTPLHHASQKGHTSVAQTLLVTGASKINGRDRMGFSPLDLAVQQHTGAVVGLLLFYGAEDVDGEARKCSHVAAEKGTEAGVQEMVEKAMDLNLADPRYRRTPLHWAAWKGSTRALEWLLECRANQELADRFGDMPLHVAVMGGWVAGIEGLLKRQVDINVKGHKGESSLHKAASVGNKSVVQLLLDRNANIEARDDGMFTPLHKATSNGHAEVVQLLLDRGADYQATDDSHQTPLHLAAEVGHSATVKLLLVKHAATEATGNDGLTPLHKAANNGHSATVSLLLDKGANKEAGNYDRYTPLHYAAKNGHLATVELLLANGANMDARNVNRYTPLHSAANGGHSATVELLLDKGADKEANNSIQQTPLHFAAHSGHSTTVELLLIRGANKEASNNYGETPLHKAAHSGHSATVELLLIRGANKEASSTNQWRALHYAANNGHSATVGLLLDRTTDREARDYDRQTPLHVAAQHGDWATVELLLDRGADQEAKCAKHQTPLHCAAGRGHSATVELLLDRGANKENLNIKFQTTLHNAAENGHLATVELLLDRGAKKEARDVNQKTPLHLSASNGHLATVRLLLDRGADREARDELAQTPLHLAAKSGDSASVELLLARGADQAARDFSGQVASDYAVIDTMRRVFEARAINTNPPLASLGPN